MLTKRHRFVLLQLRVPDRIVEEPPGELEVIGVLVAEQLLTEEVYLELASLAVLKPALHRVAKEECSCFFMTDVDQIVFTHNLDCLLYTSPSPRDRTRSRMPSSA